MPNFAALRAAVFPLSTKNLRGGYPPPEYFDIVVRREASQILYLYL